MLEKMAPSSQGSVSIYLIKIQLESQPSVLKIIYEEAAEGQTWGETVWASLTSRNFTSSSGGNYGRVRRGGWTSPSPFPLTVGKWSFMQISQHFGSDQESLTSMKATSPAGRGQPGAGNKSHLHTLTSLSLTPCSSMGDGKAQKTDGPFSPSLCHNPHTSDGYKVREGILHFKLFKRYSFSLKFSIMYIIR